MQEATERFSNRFSSLFDQDGLTNIKFFLANGAKPSLADLRVDVADLQAVIASKRFVEIESVDANIVQKRFDVAF